MKKLIAALYQDRLADYLRLHEVDYVLIKDELYAVNGDYAAAAAKIDIQESLWYGGLRK